MSLKDMINIDVDAVFFNPDEFGVTRDVKYDGKLFKNVPMVFIENQDGDQPKDYAHGTYTITDTVYIRTRILGRRPEVGSRVKITTKDGGTFFRNYEVRESKEQMEMVKLGLEAIDE